MAGTRTMALLATSLVLASLAAVLVVLGGRGWPPVALAGGSTAGLALELARAFREQRDRRAERERTAPVPPPSRETLLELEEPVRACPRCGGTELLLAVRGRGGEAIECPRCGFLGAPQTFWRKEEYAGFVRALAR